MTKNKNEIVIVFAGGGTGGHIYPGLAVADSFRYVCNQKNKSVKIYWIGNSAGMDRDIVSKNFDSDGINSADCFFGIPSGKLRRYVSFWNFLDIFKIIAGFVCSFFILLKVRPDVLFSKGGFVSVPPCFCAKLLGIPVYTHECDFTPGLATRLNARFADKILVSYKETAGFLGGVACGKTVFTGNPVRPVFYSASSDKGLDFIGIRKKDKPVLLVVGGSLGAMQINSLVKENLEWLCARFYVVHQTGSKNAEENPFENVSALVKTYYKPFAFIYSEMPDVIACSDIVLSRAGANSLWECAVLKKTMLLVPLCGSGTRGDQEDNASYFENAGAALVLSGRNADSARLRSSLEFLLDENNRSELSKKAGELVSGERPAQKIAELLYSEVSGGGR